MVIRRRIFLSLFALATFRAASPAAAQDETTTVDALKVTASRLTDSRNGIQPDTGASTYTVTSDNIQAEPGGNDAGLNQVVLQAPGVAQDSFGQLHVRGDHNGLQYRINGIIIPEGISGFGQALDPRFVESLELITGALPAEYGNRTAGVVDILTNTGLSDPGGQVGVYGGAHGQITPSFDYGGSSGRFSYFVSGDYTTTGLGVESPDGSSNPLHDQARQWHGFAYLQDILDQNSSLSAILGASNGAFQIPNQKGLQPSGVDGITGLGLFDPTSGNDRLLVDGQSSFLSNGLNERQNEISQYAVLNYLRSKGRLDLSLSAFARYSSLDFRPDPLGDLLYDGIAQTAFKRDAAYGLQTEGTFRASEAHTLRGGLLYQADDILSRTNSQVLPVDGAGDQTSDLPVDIADSSGKHAWNWGGYVQDEWQLAPRLVVNAGLRYDQFQAFEAESQLSPRINFVWTPTAGTAVHGGYSRYFTPPPIELVASSDIALFSGTSAAPAGTANDTPKAERANYYDLGINQSVTSHFTAGLDGFYKTSVNMIDEGQFGAPIILTPFNYRDGRQYGVDLTGAYKAGNLSAYLNASYERAVGRDIVSSQFQFDSGDLTYIATHFIPLDHQQLVTASAGGAYRMGGTTLSADLLYGSGLRRDGATPNGDHVPAYAQVNLAVSHEFKLAAGKPVTARIDVINLFDQTYEIRDGSGIGVGAPQFGPRRGVFLGLSRAL